MRTQKIFGVSVNYLLFVIWLFGIGLVCWRFITKPSGLALLLICLCLTAYLFCRCFIPSRCVRWLVWPWVALLCAVVLFIFRGGLGLAVYVVPSGSMLPTIPLNSLILVDTWTPSSQLTRCDIVAFSYQQQVMIKRLVALPEDKVEIAGNAARINGHESTCLGPIDAAPPVSVQPKTTQLRADEFFMLGDNRRYSSDSRVFGPVRQTELLGRVKWVWHP